MSIALDGGPRVGVAPPAGNIGGENGGENVFRLRPGAGGGSSDPFDPSDFTEKVSTVECSSSSSFHLQYHQIRAIENVGAISTSKF